MMQSKTRMIAMSMIAMVMGSGLIGCSERTVKPMHEVNRALRQLATSQRAPVLGQDWLVTLINQRGREKIALIDLRNGRRPVPLPGLNRADSQPISVCVSADGEKLALVRQRENQTEVVFYRRSTALVQRLEINPRGVPRQVSMSGDGKQLAVQVSRDGRWDIDLIRLPG